MARILGVLLAGVVVAGCGGDEGEGDGAYDPWRYERTVDEWAEDCPRKSHQLYTSAGTPYCPETWPEEFCIRYYGGDDLRWWIEDERAYCAEGEKLIVCFDTRPDAPSPAGLYCVTPDEARKRSL